MNEETPAPPPGILITDHFIQPFGYHSHRSAGTRDWLLTYTIGGEGLYRLGTLTQHVRAEDVVLLAPSVPHDYATQPLNQPWDFYWVHFLPRPHWTQWLFSFPQVRPGFFVLSVHDAAIQARLHVVLERLVRDSFLPNIFQKDLALNALEEGIILLAQQQAKYAEHSLDPRIEVVLQHLVQHISDPLSVGKLAHIVALSPSRLSHLFKAQVGDSLAATLLKLRLRHAARFLEFTAQSVNEIALNTGFQSPFHFSRQFKAYYGMSPTMYREHCRLSSNSDLAHFDDSGIAGL